MEQTNKWKTAFLILGGLILLAGGFFIGRSTIKPKIVHDIEYIKGDSVKVEVPYPVPVQVVKPIDTANVILACKKSGKYYELFPEKVRDSIIYLTKQDSTDVIVDWATERYYEQKLFDIDTVGTATVKAKTQYNRLTWMEGTFVPVTKVVTETENVIKRYSPYIGTGLTTQPTVLGEFGVFLEDKYGVGVLYQYDWKNQNHIFGTTFKVKF